MKKALLIIGIILLAAGLISIGLGLWFHHFGGSIMDGSASVYARAYRLQRTFSGVGIGVSLVGAALIVISRVIKG